MKSGGKGILPVSAQHGQDGHATQSAAVFAPGRPLGEQHGFDLGQVLRGHDVDHALYQLAPPGRVGAITDLAPPHYVVQCPLGCVGGRLHGLNRLQREQGRAAGLSRGADSLKAGAASAVDRRRQPVDQAIMHRIIEKHFYPEPLL